MAIPAILPAVRPELFDDSVVATNQYPLRRNYDHSLVGVGIDGVADCSCVAAKVVAEASPYVYGVMQVVTPPAYTITGLVQR
jgi:hypothetical protein